jgi:hypothetical protein
MQNPFESELADADELEGTGDSLEDEFEDALDESDAAEMGDGLDDEAAFADEAEGFEEEAFEDAAFEEEGFEEAEAFEDAEAFEEEDSLEAEGFEEDEFAEDSLDAAEEDALSDSLDESDELDDVFAEAMDAADEDEFARRISARFARLRRVARPYLRRMTRRALPIALRLIRHAARHRLASGASRVDAMDAFADAAADEAAAGRGPAASYIPFLAGLAGRYLTRAILSAAGRRRRPGAARAFGRAVTRATRKAAKALVRKRGPRALRSIPAIARKVARVARRRRGAAKHVPRMMLRAASRVAASPRATARLSRPVPIVRRMRARAGVGRRVRVTDAGGIVSGGRARRRAAGLRREL